MCSAVNGSPPLAATTRWSLCPDVGGGGQLTAGREETARWKRRQLGRLSRLARWADRGSNVSNTTRGQLVGRRTTSIRRAHRPPCRPVRPGPSAATSRLGGAVVAGRVPDGRECVVERLTVVRAVTVHQLDHGQADQRAPGPTDQAASRISAPRDSSRMRGRGRGRPAAASVERPRQRQHERRLIIQECRAGARGASATACREAVNGECGYAERSRRSASRPNSASRPIPTVRTSGRSASSHI